MVALVLSVILFVGCRKDADTTSAELAPESSETTVSDSTSGGVSALASRSGLLVESLFDGSNYLSGWSRHASTASYAQTQSTERVRSGKALRLEVRNNDRSTGGSIRSQITRGNDPMN